MAEGRVIDLDVVSYDPFRLEKGLQDLVGGARIDVIVPLEHPALGSPPFIAHQVFDRRDRLLVWCGSSIEYVPGTLLALVLDGIEQEPIELLEDRQHRFP